MALSPGTRLGPYEVTGELGSGGMGEVYRAHDTKLGRAVALKILPEAFAGDPDRLARFEREARTLAALSHAHIAQVYGFEQGSAGQTTWQALVMELVPGESLAQRLRRGRLTTAEALEFARQIADGLSAAHDLGIIHRDLKPANIQITPDGTVKLLDFGLAKTTGRAEGDSHRTAAEADASVFQTMTALTEAGIVLGTAAYMSPEQAKGFAVDRRTDVWAFGCVLYEMLTGRCAFDERNLSELLASVLKGEVDWNALPDDVPPMTRGFLQRCLHRDVRQRLHDIADMRLALEGAFDAAAGPAGDRGAPWRRLLIAGVTLALAGVAVTLGWRRSGPGAAAPEVTRMRLELPAGNDFYFNGRHLVAVSPDGTHVAYGAGLGLWLQSLDELDPTPVPGAELEGRTPFFSPDGHWIGYYSAGEMRRAPVGGGAPVTMAKAVNPWGITWADDGMVYYGQGPEGIWRVASTGGTPERLIAVGAGEVAHRPQLLPGGEWLLFTLLPAGVGSWDRANIVVESLKTHERTRLVEGGRDARYLSSGHLLYAVHGTLHAAPFDAASRRLTGPAMPVVQSVFDGGTITGAVHFDVSANGTMAFVPRIGTALRMVWVDRRGNEEPIPGELRPFRHPRISPDGTRIVVEVEEPSNTDIWVGDSRRGTFARLTNNQDVDSDPIWTPDGSRVVFTSVRGSTGLFVQSADGSGGATRVVEGTGGVRPVTWTANGELGYEELAGADVLTLPLAGASKPRQTLLFDRPEYFNERLPAISPDGRWIAYQSTESGEMEVFVRPFPGTASGRWQISVGGGFAPLWSRDGQEILYRSQRSLMAVAVTTKPVFSHAAPQPLFRLGDYVLAGTRGVRYDVAPDGRFLILKDEEGREIRNRIVVVQHWFQELARVMSAR